MADDTGIQQKRDQRQITFELNKKSVGYWRRTLLIRYFTDAGKDPQTNIVWSDYDKKSRLLTLNDESKPFSEKILDPNLFKSVVQIHYKGNKLLTITLFYTTYKCLVQGIQCQGWIKREFDNIKKMINMCLKGDNPKILDGKIKNMRPSNFTIIDNKNSEKEISVTNHSSDDNEDFEETNPKTLLDVHDKDTDNTEKNSEVEDEHITRSNYTCIPNDTNSKEDESTRDQRNCECKKDIDKIKETLHKMELLFIEKFQTIDKVNELANKLISIEMSNNNMCHKITEMSTITKGIKSEMIIISEKVEKEHKETRKLTEKNISKAVDNITMETQKCIKEKCETILTTQDKNTAKILHSTEKIDETCLKEIIDKLEKSDKSKTKEKTELSEHKIERIENINRLNSSKSNEPQRNIDVLIIGTSVVKDLEPRKIYRNKQVKINTLKEKTIKGARSFIQSQSNKTPINNVVIQVGSNDLDFEDSVDQVIPPFMELLKETKESMPPDCNIFVGEILPRFYQNRTETRKFDEKRLDFNKILENHTEEYGFTIIRQKNMTRNDFRDGIHLSLEKGVPTYVRNLKEILNPILGISSGNNQQRRERVQYNRGYNHQYGIQNRHQSYSNGHQYANYNDNQYQNGREYPSYQNEREHLRQEYQRYPNEREYQNRHIQTDQNYPYQSEERNNVNHENDNMEILMKQLLRKLSFN
ncbi:unnamed protein product [Mytilus edulis]|uniref:Uncharacterized protein n=1 Tax=Mytilus edulis TaxID=6550 RepID=A0A8S3QA53_MYTED|nr:unnamed protein product [Mytilus edulis]